MTDQDQTISDLRREIAGLRFGLFLAATAILVALALWNLLSIARIPGGVGTMEKIFEDMLGSKDRLPMLTQWVIVYCDAVGRMLPAIVICCFTLVAWALMNLMRNSWKFIPVAVGAALVLMLHGAILNFSMYMPLMQIIQGINDKT